MDVRVEAGLLTAVADLVKSKVFVEAVIDVIISAPSTSRFSLAPVISIAGHSISSINPHFSRIGAMATA
jgi:hypothetical protein